jgi:hypothetical protein
MLQPESSLEQAIRNKWLRDVLENERELEFYKVQYLAAAILMPIVQKADTLIATHKKVISKCYPWEEVTEEQSKDAALKEAIQKYQAMQNSSTIQDVKKDVEVNEMFTKWKDPLLDDEEPK